MTRPRCVDVYKRQAFDRGLANALASEMGAPCFCLPELAAESLVKTVQDSLRLTGGQ